MLDSLETHARRAARRLPASTCHWAVRGVHERSERLSAHALAPWITADKP
jgi:hypothetical protein